MNDTDFKVEAIKKNKKKGNIDPKKTNCIPVPIADNKETFSIKDNLFLKFKFLNMYLIK